MPELPEVETVARQLDALVAGRRIRRMFALDPKLESAVRRDLKDRTVARVFRIGKQVVLEIAPAPDRDDERCWLAVHLRMTGRLVWSESRRRPSRLRAAIEMDGGSLQLLDVRRFGTLSWVRSPAELSAAGLDPVSRGFTPRALEQLLAGCRQQIKPWLLRQDRLVGVGNIYAAEILHRARISPFRRARALRKDEIRRLHSATRRTLGLAIKWNGTTFSDFQDAHGVTGGFLRFLQVYDREGLPCRRCRTPIRRAVQQQRSTYYCPHCVGPRPVRSSRRSAAAP